jgi:hypothetical protein
MGRTTCNSTLWISFPWSLSTGPDSITQHLLGDKSCFLALIGTQSSSTRKHGPPVLAALLHYPPGTHVWKAVWRLGSSIPAAVAKAPGSLRACSACKLGSWKPTPNASRPQGLHCLMSTRRFKPTTLLPQRYPQLATQCQEPATIYLSELQALLFYWCQEASFPIEHRGPELLTVPDSKRACAPCQVKEWEHQIPHWGEGNYNLLLCRQHKKPCSPKVHRSPALHAAPPCRRVTSLLSRVGIPTPPLSGKHYSASARRCVSQSKTSAFPQKPTPPLRI